MLISDWSSDVCSSDLTFDLRDGLAILGQDRLERANVGGLQRAFEHHVGIAERAEVHQDLKVAVFIEAAQIGECIGPDLDRLISEGLAEYGPRSPRGDDYQIGRAHVCTPVTHAHIVCSLLL